jgi:hypothetical protein
MGNVNWSVALSMLLKPLVLALGLCALAAIRIAIIKWMPDCKLKRLFLLRVE